VQTLALVTAKGGSGKTTLVASIGVAAMQAGERVYLVDLDPQGSLLSWGERRQQTDPPVDRITPDKLAAALTGLAKQGFTLAIVDTAGVDTAATSAAMRAADLSIIPARPSVLDLEASKPTMQALTRLQRPYCFVLNACPAGRSARLEDAGRALSLLGILATPPIVLRADHVDAIGLGMGVTESNGTGKAAEEIRQLWTWVKRRLKTNGQAATSVTRQHRSDGAAAGSAEGARSATGNKAA
jgi:chromosome partitioning protein